MRFFCSIILLILVSFCIQEFIPVFDWAFSSRLLLVHAVFFTAAVAVPFPVMLGLALATGFLWDARYHLPMYPPDVFPDAFIHAELPFGFTIFIFGVMGSFIQGVRPLFRRGRWELPILMVGLCTALGLMFEYLVICFHRGGLETPAELWWKLLMTALFSALVSPLLLLLLGRVADRVRYRIRTEGLKRRYTYDGDAL
tara:strand:- start:2683 stop:3276 length:594 start_codon:yes stop_codon:yes gene_type:complete